jgi:hypothetical protein
MSKTQRRVITGLLVLVLVGVAAPITSLSRSWAFWGGLLLALPASLALALTWASELRDFLAHSPGWKSWASQFEGGGKPLGAAMERGLNCLVEVAEWAGKFKDAFFRSASPELLFGKSLMSVVALFFLTVFGLRLMSTGPLFAKVFGLALVSVGGMVLAVIWAPEVRHSLVDETGPAPNLSSYAVAAALRQQGRFQESLAEVQQQLATRPNDFLGLVLQAEIQAENLHDFGAAQTALDQIINAPGQSPQNLAYAFNQLATWHLKFNQDSVAARHALEKILNRFPQTPWAQAARQRISQLRTAGDAPRAAAPVAKTPVAPPAASAPATPAVSWADPVAATSELVSRLEKFPEDLAAREQLARLYADHYHRPDLAADQLTQLIAFPGQPAAQVNRQLRMLIDVQLKQPDGLIQARQALRQIIDQNPQTLAARLAQQQGEKLGA